MGRGFVEGPNAFGEQELRGLVTRVGLCTVPGLGGTKQGKSAGGGWDGCPWQQEECERGGGQHEECVRGGRGHGGGRKGCVGLAPIRLSCYDVGLWSVATPSCRSQRSHGVSPWARVSSPQACSNKNVVEGEELRAEG
jgi:hypothetical protein